MAALTSGLSSVPAGCVTLAPEDLYGLAVAAGFPPATAVTMAAVALRESSGCPYGHYTGATGTEEDSYGLWAINVKANPGVIAALGLSSPTDLYDPATNAAAAAWLWGGNDANLDVAWYVNRPGYKEGWQKWVPTVLAALGSTGTGTVASTSGDTGDQAPATSGGVSTGMIVAMAAGVLGLALIAQR